MQGKKSSCSDLARASTSFCIGGKKDKDPRGWRAQRMPRAIGEDDSVSAAERKWPPERSGGHEQSRQRPSPLSRNGERQGPRVSGRGYSRRRTEEHTSELQSLMRISHAG